MGKLVDLGARRQFEAASSVITERALKWCIWKALLPAFLLGLLWPVYGVILKLPHPFQRAFAHGDLLIFAALILIEATLEGDHMQKQSVTFRLWSDVGRLVAILLIFLYGFMKYDAILQESAFEKAAAARAQVLDKALLKAAALSQAQILDKLRAYSCFSCSVAAVALIASFCTFAVVVDLERTEELRRLGLS